MNLKSRVVKRRRNTRIFSFKAIELFLFFKTAIFCKINGFRIYLIMVLSIIQKYKHGTRNKRD